MEGHGRSGPWNLEIDEMDLPASKSLCPAPYTTGTLIVGKGSADIRQVPIRTDLTYGIV